MVKPLSAVERAAIATLIENADGWVQSVVSRVLGAEEFWRGEVRGCQPSHGTFCTFCGNEEHSIDCTYRLAQEPV